MARLVSVCLVVILAAGCASKPQPVLHQVSLEDNGGSVTMAVGDQLQVTLPEMQFEGYDWRAEYYDPSAFELQHEDVAGAGGISLAQGGAVPQLFLFLAKKPTKFTLKLVHVKEGNMSQPDKIYEVEVTVVNEIVERPFE